VTTIEDRLRAATRAAAETVAPGSAPPLRLPDHPSRGRAGRWRRGRRWAGWLTPLAAAAAVTGVVAGSLAISGVFRSHHSHPAQSFYVNPEQVPPYYVALRITGSLNCCQPGALDEPRTRALVRATATGAVLATVTPPKPYGTFVGVAAAADDRTFVLAAQREVRIGAGGIQPPATKFFLLRINPAGPAGGRASLTPLPIPAEPGGADYQLWNFALSPNGRSLALLSEWGIQVFNLATGAGRTWVIPIPGKKLHRGLGGYFALGGSATNAMIAWGSSQTLAWVYYGGPPVAGSTGAGVRFLDTRAPGTNLLTNGRLAVPTPKSIPDPGAYWRQALPIAGGRAVLAVLEVSSRHGIFGNLVEFSARTGRAVRVLNHIRFDGNYEQVLWASPSGHKLVVTGTQRGKGQGRYLSGAGVLTGDRFTPIPWANATSAAAW
jgi:hypothetical protein